MPNMRLTQVGFLNTYRKSAKSFQKVACKLIGRSCPPDLLLAWTDLMRKNGHTLGTNIPYFKCTSDFFVVTNITSPLNAYQKLNSITLVTGEMKMSGHRLQ